MSKETSQEDFRDDFLGRKENGWGGLRSVDQYGEGRGFLRLYSNPHAAVRLGEALVGLRSLQMLRGRREAANDVARTIDVLLESIPDVVSTDPVDVLGSWGIDMEPYVADGRFLELIEYSTEQI